MGRAVRARPGLPAPARQRRDGRGRVAPVADGSEAQLLALEEELRRRALVDELLDRLPADPTRLSALPELDEQSFDLLLDAIGQALTGGTVGYSDDGTLQLTVFDMGAERPVAALRVGDGGVLESPDLLVQVGRVTRMNEDRLRDARRALLASPAAARERSRVRRRARERRAAARGVPARARLRARRAREPRAAAQALG